MLNFSQFGITFKRLFQISRINRLGETSDQFFASTKINAENGIFLRISGKNADAHNDPGCKKSNFPVSVEINGLFGFGFLDFLKTDEIVNSRLKQKRKEETTDEEGTKYGGGDTNCQSDTKSFHRTGTQPDQNTCGDQGGEVCVNNGGKSL